MKTKISFCMYHIITGGIENCLLRILEQFSNNPNYQFYVITKKSITQNWHSLLNKYNTKVIIYENDLYYGNKPQNKILRRLWKIKNLPKKIIYTYKKHRIKKFLNTCDIIIDYFNGSFFDEFKNIKKPKKIIFYHASIEMYKKHMYNRKILTTYDKFVCLTESFYNDICQIHPEYKYKFTVIYNAINIKNIRELSNNSNYFSKKPFFLFVGRLHEDKDHLTVIDAFYKFFHQVKDGRLIFIGDGPNRENITNYIQELNIQNHIEILGTISNPLGYMKYALANILSSPSEGLSTVLIEGAVVGALNVASDCPSCASEILLNGQAGLLFPVGDSDALTDIMLKIWYKQIDREKFINNGYSGLSRFDAKNIIPQINELFQSCITSSK